MEPEWRCFFVLRYRGLPFQSRALVVVGFVLTAWGMGSFLNALLAGRRKDQLPPTAPYQ
jgi:hypothetical protein